MSNPFARVLDDTTIRRTAKKVGIPLEVVRKIYRDSRACYTCGPDNWKDVLADTHNTDLVQRRSRDSSEAVWVCRDECALIWERLDSLELPELERVHDFLKPEYIKTTGH